jgi:phosphoribosylanthranilate isomerase
MVKVKICGITNHEDAQKAVYYGAWAAGFIFHKKSPRYVSPSKARRIIEALPPFVTPVGVFVDLKERAIHDICRFTRIRTVQLHGGEEPAFCSRLKKDYTVIKAFRVSGDFRLAETQKYKTAAGAYLFDAFVEGVEGGTGRSFNWRLLEGVKFDRPAILSGGLTPENVAEGAALVKPYAVDVCGGVEKSPGLKDPKKIRDFMAALGVAPGA